MKFIYCTLLTLSFFSSFAQTATWDAITRPSLYLHLSSFGFKSTSSNSGNSLSDQYSGIGGSYVQGLGQQFDLALSLYGFRVYYPFRNMLNYRTKNTLYELDGSLQFRILRNKHLVNPFLTAGIGAYYYVDTYGSFVPLGGGLQFNFHEKFYTALSAQYRVPINAQTEYHYIYSVSAGIPLTKRKNRNASSSTVKDTDRDGIPDEEDACPKQAGLFSNNGCPENVSSVKVNKQLASYKVFFFTDQTALPEESTGILQVVVNTLKTSPKSKIQIDGYTDNIEFNGESQSNSLLRAQAIANFLMEKGISERRIKVAGQGTNKPRDTNETVVGRSQNRRVEITIIK